jgi:GDP-L-fucose synthase
MKLLITGGNGMVGKNLQNHPASQQYELLTPSSKELNLLDYQTTVNYLSYTKPDLIIHAAGKVGGIKANMADPYGFLYANMTIGFNLVQAAKTAGITKLLNLGSSCMYPKDASNPLNEEQILDGKLEPTNEGYALAKISVAKLCVAASNERFQYKTLIPCNLYGLWDKFGATEAHLIPAVIAKIHAIKNTDKPIEIWGTGNVRREFMFAEDLADFIYFVLPQTENLSHFTNVGIGTDLSILEYYNTVKEVIGIDAPYVFDVSKPEGMKQKVVDITQQKKLGWNPKTSLKLGIEKTYEYYRSLQNEKLT